MTFLFAASLFLSALLLFTVQPMVGKMLLPLLGGSPAVWNTCMLFFQTMLLGGYAYAHGTTATLGVRRQAAIHMALLLAAFLVLPIALAPGVVPPTDANPIPWLLLRLLLTAGLPFFVISSTAPLLQKWFAHTDHPKAADPYFLYVASNLGSLLALLAYPLVIERIAAISTQSRAWFGGYLLLIAMIASCAAVMWRSKPRSAPAPDRAKRPPTPDTPIDRKRRGRWILLAAVPSSLMLGVTTHMSTNVAAMPLLWVIPLAVYLLTFVLVFSPRQPISHAAMVRLLPYVVLAMGPLFFIGLPGLEWRSLIAHVGLFFVAAMVCHGRLAQDRPAAQHLTGYYLWISVGGAVGGVLNAILAPLLFNDVIEYPLAVCAACMLMPSRAASAPTAKSRRLDILLPAGLAALLAGIVLAISHTQWRGTWTGLGILFIIGAGFCVAMRKRPLRFGLAFAGTLLAFAMYDTIEEGRRLYVERNFFGRNRVVIGLGGKAHLLFHGTTVHGLQRTEDKYATLPLSYYHLRGPIGDVFTISSLTQPLRPVAAVGLGAGAVACYAMPGQRITFYEIDPSVVRIARDPRYFTFLSRCEGICDVVQGDGRLTLARAADGEYGLILLDAYSSDAIPLHLLTREALQMYVAKLADGGVLAFHITNQYLHLEPVVARLAADAGLACIARTQTEAQIPESEQRLGASPSHVVAMARRAEDLARLAGRPGWHVVRADPARPVWTDQYCDLLGTLFAGEHSPAK